MDRAPINFREKLARFSEHWTPKVVARMNDDLFKLVRIQGDFVWHRHEGTDEAFIVLEGRMRIDFRDGPVDLEAGEMLVVPRGGAQALCREGVQAAGDRAGRHGEHGECRRGQDRRDRHLDLKHFLEGLIHFQTTHDWRPA